MPGGNKKVAPKHARTHGDVHCVCEICSCGTHRCPATPLERHHYDTGLASDYASKFKGGLVPLTRPAKPEYVHSSKPFEGKTDYQDHFVPLDKAQRSKIAPKAGAVTLGYLYGDDRKFQPGSMYRDNFTPKPGQKTANYKPTDAFIQSGKFEGDTTSRAAYVSNPEHKTRAPFKPISKLTDLKEDRNWETERSKHFADKAYSARPSFKPKQSLNESAGPFAGQSSNATDFPHWKDARPATAFMPAPTVSDNTPDDRKFETENRSGFNKKPNAQRAPFKAVQSVHANGAPFHAESTSKAHFPHWRDAKPSTPADHAQNIERHAEDRKFETMNRTDFPPKKSDVTRAKVHQTIALPKEDRDFATTSGTGGHTGNHTRKPFVPMPSLVHTGPFSGVSTNADSYKPQKQAVRAPFKPSYTAHGVPETRDFTTEGRNSYQGAPPEPCESLQLPERHQKKKSGHKHYEWHHNNAKWNPLV